jgi:hypothetical protein
MKWAQDPVLPVLNLKIMLLLNLILLGHTRECNMHEIDEKLIKIWTANFKKDTTLET